MMSPTGFDNRFTPRLEGLEAREVPAVQIFAADHVLHVTGDAHANVITVHDNGKGTITIDVGGEHFTASGIDKIQIVTGGAGDHVNYQMTGPVKVTEDIQVRLGKGADKANFNFSDGVAATGHLKLTVDGGKGADTETVKIGSIAKGGSAALDMNGGKGKDTLDLHSSGKVAGNLTAHVNGGAGHNAEDVVTHDTITKTGHINVNVV